MVTVTFTVSSSATVTGIMVSWGDGTTPDALSGTAISDTHIYASTGNAKAENFTITVTATNSAGPGSGTTLETINDRPPVVTISNVSPNPAQKGKVVTVTFSATDPDGTISSFSVNWGDSSTPDSLAGTATSDTHMYNVTGSFSINVTATDNSGSTGSATTTETVTLVTITPVMLFFQAQAPQSPARGAGMLQVFVNGQHVVDVTPGMVNFTSFGPLDITAFVILGGQNNVSFVNPQTNQFDLVKNVTVTQGSATLLHVTKVRSISPGASLTYTFSVPALVLTSFTASSTHLSVGQESTFTATFTGGTPRFKCIFQFGDGESSSITVNSGSCSATHDFDNPGGFRAKVTIVGSSTSDRVSASIRVAVGHSSEDDD